MAIYVIIIRRNPRYQHPDRTSASSDSSISASRSDPYLHPLLLHLPPFRPPLPLPLLQLVLLSYFLLVLQELTVILPVSGFLSFLVPQPQ